MSTDTHTGNDDRGDGRRWSPLRLAGWTGAGLLLLAPLVAMQVTEEVVWTPGDFAFAAALLLGVGVPIELAVRKTGSFAYRAGAGVALLAAFLMVWSSGAVGITDGAGDLLYIGMLGIGIIGAFVARFRPHGMAQAMAATALGLVAAGVITVAAGLVPETNTAVQILAITGFFVALFAGSAWLFLKAADVEA